MLEDTCLGEALKHGFCRLSRMQRSGPYTTACVFCTCGAFTIVWFPGSQGLWKYEVFCMLSTVASAAFC